MTAPCFCAGLKDSPQAQNHDPSFEPLNGVVSRVVVGWRETLFHCEDVSGTTTENQRLSQGETATVSESGRPSHWNCTSQASRAYPSDFWSGYVSRRPVLCAVKLEILLCDYTRHEYSPAAAVKARVCDAFASACWAPNRCYFRWTRC